MEKISSIYRIFMLEKKLPVENSSNRRLFFISIPLHPANRP